MGNESRLSGLPKGTSNKNTFLLFFSFENPLIFLFSFAMTDDSKTSDAPVPSSTQCPEVENDSFRRNNMKSSLIVNCFSLKSLKVKS